MKTRSVRYGATPEEMEYFEGLVSKYGSPLLVISRSKLIQQYQSLKNYLPGVSMYYAIKAFPNPDVIRVLAEQGCNFDVASEGEIELLKPYQISGRKTIHTHPIKKGDHIKAALRGGSTTFVVDNIDELKKMIPFRQRVGVLLRVSFRSETASVDLSRKFGCSPAQVRDLVLEAQQYDIHIRGLSFHVGSQSLSSNTHVDAIKKCAQLIEEINEEIENPMNVLDIGGGFPVDYAQENPDLAGFFQPIHQALSELPDYLSIIAEPGRYLVAPAVTGISSVTGIAKRGEYMWYYLDDGVYGSYSGQIFDHVLYPLQIPNDSEPRTLSILSGPTCDSIDIISEDIMLPELREGELVIGHMMGAYTAATSTRFNSLSGARIILED